MGIFTKSLEIPEINKKINMQLDTNEKTVKHIGFYTRKEAEVMKNLADKDKSADNADNRAVWDTVTDFFDSFSDKQRVTVTIDYTAKGEVTVQIGKQPARTLIKNHKPVKDYVLQTLKEVENK